MVNIAALGVWNFKTERGINKERVSDSWRVRYLANLLEQRQHFHYQATEEEVERLSELIDSLCIN